MQMDAWANLPDQFGALMGTDGNIWTFFHSGTLTDGWWFYIDLESPHKISYIRIVNRQIDNRKSLSAST